MDITEEKKQEIADKIQKLLALSKSPNEHEATLAMEMAQKLLIKYNLDMASIKGDKNKEEIVLVNEIADLNKKRPWLWNLIAAIAHSNFCKTIKSGNDIHILGRKANVHAVIEMYDWLEPQVIRLAGLSGYTSGEKTSYSLGIISTIRRRLTETMEKAKINNDTKALVINVQSEIDNWYNQQYPTARTGRRTIIRTGAYVQGQNDGHKISVYGSNRQVSNGVLQLT